MDDYKNTPEGKRTARIYRDIINLTRPYSSRPKMDLTQRAKIFSPYDALRGFDEEIEHTEKLERMTTRRILSDDIRSEVSEKISQLQKGMAVTVRYFMPEVDDMGYYTDISGKISDIFPEFKKLEITEDVPASEKKGKFRKSLPAVINFDNILSIE